MSEFIEQDNSSLNYSINERSNINLEACLESISINGSQSQSISNPSDSNQQIILKIINNSNLKNEQNENIYKNLYEELQTKFNTIQEENNKLKIENNELKKENNKLKIENNELKKENNKLKTENEKLESENEELKKELNNYKEKENEIKNENNSLSFINRENLDLSLTKKNSGSSIYLSSCLNDEEINELNEAKINQSLAEIKKIEKNLKIKEIYNVKKNNKVIKSVSENDLEFTKKIEEEKKQFYKDINNFRKKYNLSNLKKYPDDIIIKTLRENNFDEEKAFQFLIK